MRQVWRARVLVFANILLVVINHLLWFYMLGCLLRLLFGGLGRGDCGDFVVGRLGVAQSSYWGASGQAQWAQRVLWVQWVQWEREDSRGMAAAGADGGARDAVQRRVVGKVHGWRRVALVDAAVVA